MVDVVLPTALVALVAGAVAVQRFELLGGRTSAHPSERVVLYPAHGRTRTSVRDDVARIGTRDLRGRRRRILAVVDHDDAAARADLERLRAVYPHLDVLVAPDAADPSWSAAWASWLADASVLRDAVRRRGRRFSPHQRRQVVFGHHHLAAASGAAVEGVHTPAR